MYESGCLVDLLCLRFLRCRNLGESPKAMILSQRSTEVGIDRQAQGTKIGEAVVVGSKHRTQAAMCAITKTSVGILTGSDLTKV